MLEKKAVSVQQRRDWDHFLLQLFSKLMTNKQKVLCVGCLCCLCVLRHHIIVQLTQMVHHIISYSHSSCHINRDHIQSSSLFAYCVNQHLVREEGDEKVHLVGEDRHQALRDPCPHLEQVRKAVTWTTCRPLRINFEQPRLFPQKLGNPPHSASSSLLHVRQTAKQHRARALNLLLVL